MVFDDFAFWVSDMILVQCLEKNDEKPHFFFQEIII
jgi:hypothetical protein